VRQELDADTSHGLLEALKEGTQQRFGGGPNAFVSTHQLLLLEEFLGSLLPRLQVLLPQREKLRDQQPSQARHELRRQHPSQFALDVLCRLVVELEALSRRKS
jgi:hypothetical protein